MARQEGGQCSIGPMRARTAWVAGAAGAAIAVYRKLRPQPAAAPEADPRAEELRQKLAEAREAAEHEDEFEAAGMGAETIVAEPEVDVDEARRRVHEAGRAKAEEIRESGEGDETA